MQPLSVMSASGACLEFLLWHLAVKGCEAEDEINPDLLKLPL